MTGYNTQDVASREIAMMMSDFKVGTSTKTSILKSEPVAVATVVLALTEAVLLIGEWFAGEVNALLLVAATAILGLVTRGRVWAEDTVLDLRDSFQVEADAGAEAGVGLEGHE